MADVEFNMDGLNVPQLAALGTRLAEGLKGNENFPNAGASLEQLNASLGELKATQDEYNELRKKLNALKLSRDATVSRLKQALLAGVNYVQSASGGDTKKIMSANLPFEHGLDLWPFNDPAQVTELNASAGDQPGEIDLVWDTVRGADGYEIEISRDSGWPEHWAPCAASGTSKATVGQLESRLRYWFRVRAASSKGVGGWSDPVTKFAP